MASGEDFGTSNDGKRTSYISFKDMIMGDMDSIAVWIFTSERWTRPPFGISVSGRTVNLIPDAVTDVPLYQQDQYATIRVSWFPNQEPDLQGYKVYWYLTEDDIHCIDVGKVTHWEISEMLLPKGEITFYVTACDERNESEPSKKKSILIG